MGALFEVVSTPVAYVRPAFYDAHPPRRAFPPLAVPFGPDPLQRFVWYEPERCEHETVVLYFHGGGYLVGHAESMANAADVYNSRGYRFVSVGFRLMPRHRFPAQIDDAFAGVISALRFLGTHGVPANRVVLGGTSAGGHAAALVGYGRSLQAAHGFDPSPVRGVLSMAGVMDADDMLLRPMPPGAVARSAFLDLPRVSLASDDSLHEALLPYSPIALVDGDSRIPFLAVHGRADSTSPYASEERFVKRLNEATGSELARLETIEGTQYQHIWFTVTSYKHEAEESQALRAVFGWLDAIDGVV